jgi:TorA maturation chaperone TorD
MELEFMGFLADKESDAWLNRDEKEAIRWFDLQREFFGRHISKWVFDFLHDMERYAFHPFYSEVARLTRSFLESEDEYFNQLGGHKTKRKKIPSPRRGEEG